MKAYSEFLKYMGGINMKSIAMEEDYNNFFDMLKFWVEQTNNNIENKGNRVTFREIHEGNISRAENDFNNPKFYPQYLNYQNFAIRISFVKNSHYKSEKANFIVWNAGPYSWWLNIIYFVDEQVIKVVYQDNISKDPSEVKKYMIKKGYNQSRDYKIQDLGLEEAKPNDKVKELFDDFSNMIADCKKYFEDRNKNMKSKEIATKLKETSNIILRGAPGTGKTYLAKQIAAFIISDGKITEFEKLSNEQKEQFEFVQFHPSYDYTDFVEGLRPVTSENGQVGFELKPGTFMAFCDKAREAEDTEFDSAWEKLTAYLGENEVIEVPLKNGQSSTKYRLSSVDSLKFVDINAGTLPKAAIKRTYRGEKGRASGAYQSYMTSIVQYLKEKFGLKDYHLKTQEENSSPKKYVFVIDEINRGEISKIFGELFFSIDPDYRGEKGAVSTQYSNLHDDVKNYVFNDEFYIPENVYIIGTMNDIDRSVDTFDFAMRRRFTFVEITAEESAQNMGLSLEVQNRMRLLNQEIIEQGLTQDYQIGASYFKALTEPDEDKVYELVEELWKNKLEPLLKDYFRGERNAKEKLDNLKNAYDGVGNGKNTSEG
ncbi:hypothetical protein FACS1894193_11510 [Bacilli bacterium]|nr:hypothetical protein FACS1894192_04790 [Bacilli bacterium]GHU43906.1 hypothetical protein FACS1894193_11510 [Bacilli bacterium]